MTSTQTSADLLLSLAAQVAEAKTEAEASDLYFLARGVFYSESDAGNATSELRSAWNDVAFACTARAEAKKSSVYGLVTFSDGSSYGGRQS